MNPVEQPSPNRWPPQIKFIIGNEAAERFSYYGMKSILALYITSSLMQTKDRATTIIHLAGFAVYFMPLLGAWVSDRVWGRYKTILYISLFYCAGHGVLAMSDLFPSVMGKLNCLYVGLGLIAFGAGGIKPCVSAFMGDQFGPQQSHLLRKAYAAFYFSINFGSCFAFMIIPWIAKPPGELTADAGAFTKFLWQIKQAGFTGYSWAFAVPGILMGLATLIFWRGTKHYVRKLPDPTAQRAGFFPVFLAAFREVSRSAPQQVFSAWRTLLSCLVLPAIMMVAMVYVALQHWAPEAGIPPAVKIVGWIAVICFGAWYLLVIFASITRKIDLPDAFWNGARHRFKPEEIAAARSIVPVLAVFTFVPAFWALFEQSNSTWVLQGAKMTPFKLMGAEIGAEQMQSLNPILVMTLIPLLTWGLYPLLESMGLKVTQLRRMAVGLALTASSYVVVAWLQRRLEGGETLSLAWQTLPYIIITIGEVLISTTGLEFAYTQAAPSMKSTVMSFWLLTVAIGNLFVTTITQLGGGHGDSSVTSERFMLYAGITAGVTVLLAIVATRYQYREQPQPPAPSPT